MSQSPPFSSKRKRAVFGPCVHRLRHPESRHALGMAACTSPETSSLSSVLICLHSSHAPRPTFTRVYCRWVDRGRRSCESSLLHGMPTSERGGCVRG